MEAHKLPLPRRTHQKSRLGCGNCKRRRIKVSLCLYVINSSYLKPVCYFEVISSDRYT
jgi:hypothetical protein